MDVSRKVETLHGALASFFSHPLSQRLIACKPDDLLCEGAMIPGVEQVAVSAVNHQFGQTSYSCSYNRKSSTHPFRYSETEGLVPL